MIEINQKIKDIKDNDIIYKIGMIATNKNEHLSSLIAKLYESKDPDA